MNSSTQPTPSEAPVATFGISLMPDGSFRKIKEGTFDAGQADQLASQLILLATAIRAAARQQLYPGVI